jgi:hypothetical protein
LIVWLWGQVTGSKQLTVSGRAIATLLAALLPAAPTVSPAANDCPSALSGKGSFILERRASSQQEVSYDETPIIHTSLQYGGRTLLETTMYQGLFELSRVDRGTRIEQTPKDDLGKFFPLKAKPTITADFDVTMNGSTKSKTVKLQYVGDQDYSLGECTYHVIKLHRTDTLPAVSDNIDYYAPDLRFVVAKEYRDDNGRTTVVGYTKISSGKPATALH